MPEEKEKKREKEAEENTEKKDDGKKLISSSPALKMMFILLVVVVVFVVVIIATYFMTKTVKEKGLSVPKNEIVIPNSGKTRAREALEVYPIDKINIVLRDRNKVSHSVSISMELAFKSKKAKKIKVEIKNRMPHIKDLILKILYERDPLQMTSLDGMQALKTDITNQVNQILRGKGKIKTIYFSQFVVQ